MPAHVLGQRLEIFVERPLELVHQRLDLGVAGVLVVERLLQLALNVAQAAFGQRHLAVLDTQRRIPHELLDLGNRRGAAVLHQPLLRGVQRHVDDDIIVE